MRNDSDAEYPFPIDPSNIDDAVVERYLANASPPDERARLEAAARHDASLAAIVQIATNKSVALDFPDRPVDVDRGVARIRVAIGHDTPHAAVSTVPAGTPRVPRFRNTARAARWRPLAVATLIGAAAMGAAFVVNGRRDLPASGPMQQYTAAVGQQAAFTLPDGSRMVLAPESRARVSTDFGGAHRDVYLSGKGYFSVAADPTRPFTVITNAASVQVLGTQFIVERYDRDRDMHVAVQTGRVFVTRSATFASTGPSTAAASTTSSSSVFTDVLNAGDQLTASDGATPTVTRTGDVSAAFAWTMGELAFKDTPLPKLVSEVERWYGAELTLDGARGVPAALRERRVTTRFGNVPLTVVVRELSVLLGVRVASRPLSSPHS